MEVEGRRAFLCQTQRAMAFMSPTNLDRHLLQLCKVSLTSLTVTVLNKLLMCLLSELERMAAAPRAPEKRTASDREKDWLLRLVEKYDDDGELGSVVLLGQVAS